MRKEKRENIESVYSAMKSLYDKNRNWGRLLSFKEIKNALENQEPKKTKNNWGHRKVIYRHLKTLIKEKPPRAFKVGRGLYTIDYALEQKEKERKEFTKSILSVRNFDKYEGTATIYNSSEKNRILEYLEEWRLQIHDQKDTAKAEAEVWVNSLIESLSHETLTGEAPLTIKPGAKESVKGFISRKSLEIMFVLLESIDLDYLKRDKTNSTLRDGQISVVIKFDPVMFLSRMKSNSYFVELLLNSKKRTTLEYIGSWLREKYGTTAERNSVSEYLKKHKIKIEKHIFHEIFKDQLNAEFKHDIDPDVLNSLPDWAKKIIEYSTPKNVS